MITKKISIVLLGFDLILELFNKTLQGIEQKVF